MASPKNSPARTAKPSPEVVTPLRVGNAVFIRTVTMHHTGRIAALDGDMIVLTEAAWVADSGRFSEALATGKLSEVEVPPDGTVCIGRGAVVDVYNWKHELPRSTK